MFSAGGRLVSSELTVQWSWMASVVMQSERTLSYDNHGHVLYTPNQNINGHIFNIDYKQVADKIESFCHLL